MTVDTRLYILFSIFEDIDLSSAMMFISLLCVSTWSFMCRCIGYHQQSAAFNEGNGRKINIVTVKWFHLIRLLLLISIHLLRRSDCIEAQKGWRFESLQSDNNASLSLALLYTFFLPQLCTRNSASCHDTETVSENMILLRLE